MVNLRQFQELKTYLLNEKSLFNNNSYDIPRSYVGPSFDRFDRLKTIVSRINRKLDHHIQVVTGNLKSYRSDLTC